MTLLSVNLNKIAVLRNSRGGGEPDMMRAARACLDAGAHGLTLHPRPDARHARADDVMALAGLAAKRGVELNLEGNPFAAPRPGYPGFIALCREARPGQATLVPDDDGQITSDHGFDFVRDGARLAPLVAELRAIGCRVSLFADAHDSGVDNDPAAGDAIAAAAATGADRIEIYTGPFAAEHAAGISTNALRACADTARRARAAGLGVNAGHDLSQSNLADFLAAVPGVEEVSIGHALIGEALYEGLATTVRRYLALL